MGSSRIRCPGHVGAWVQAFWEIYKVEIPEKEIYRREGEKCERSIPEILKTFEITISEDELNQFLAHKSKLFCRYESVPYFEGMPRFIEELAKTKSLAMVTGTQQAEVETLLPETFRAHF